MQKKHPNIIFVLCDDLGYGDLGYCGSQKNDTPNIDRMASEGLCLDNYYAMPLCSPSRASFLTGCYPIRVGLDQGEYFSVLMPGDRIGLNTEEYTLPKHLKNAGYTTGLIGKWHLGDQPEFMPLRQGFDYYYGLPYSNDMYPDHPNKEFHFPPLPLMDGDRVIEVNPDQRQITNYYWNKTKEFLDRNGDRQFFLYIAHMYVHWPVFPPKEYELASRNGAYGGAVAHLDDFMGNLVGYLREKGMDDNTIVVFTSDNGADCSDGGSNAPFRGRKSEAYEGGSHMPCIIWAPSKIPAGTHYNGITAVFDMYPTLAAMAGCPLEDDVKRDGMDYSEAYLTGEEKRNLHYYYEDGHLSAIRQNQWKLHIDRRELYDLAVDIGESNNLYLMHPKVVSELTELARQQRLLLGDSKYRIRGTEIRPCGYVENPVTILPFTELDKELVAREYD